MMNQYVAAAWKEAGEKWEAVSSRIISARFRVVKQGQRRPEGSRETCGIFATIISAYAPTAKATMSIKSKFYTELHDIIDRIPHSDVLIILGDINA